MSATIGIDDLRGEPWRVTVEPAFAGLSMRSTFSARLWRKKRSSGRWYEASLSVLNDDGPIQAVSDLLSMLDLGTLVAA